MNQALCNKLISISKQPTYQRYICYYIGKLSAALNSAGNNAEDRDFSKNEPHSPSAQSSISLTSTTFQMQIDLVDENTEDQNTVEKGSTSVGGVTDGM